MNRERTSIVWIRRLLAGLALLLAATVPARADVEVTSVVSGAAFLTFTPVSFGINVPATGADRYLAFEVSLFSPAVSVTSITYNGVPLTNEVVVETAGALRFRSELWGLVNPATGVHTMTMTFSGTPMLIALGVSTYTGVDQTTPVGTRARNIGTSAAPSVNVTTTSNGELIVDSLATTNSITGPINTLAWTPATSCCGGAFTLGGGSSHAAAPAPTTTAMSWTLSSSQTWAMTAMSLRPVSFTRATVEEFQSYRSATSGAIVEWRTGSEHATVGYDLMKLDPATGEFVRLNDALLPSMLHSVTGGVYRFRDREADLGDVNVYELVEVELTGARHTYGPYTVVVDVLNPEDAGETAEFDNPITGTLPDGPLLADHDDGIDIGSDATAEVDNDGEIVSYDTSDGDDDGDDDVGSHQSTEVEDSGETDSEETTEAEDDTTPTYASAPQPASPRAQARTEVRAIAQVAAKAERELREGPQLKVVVRDRGLYFVKAQTIAEKLGLPLSRIRQHLRDNTVEIASRGAQVATQVAEEASGFYFFGESVDSQYTVENVYLLSLGRGLSMQRRRGLTAPADQPYLRRDEPCRGQPLFVDPPFRRPGRRLLDVGLPIRRRRFSELRDPPTTLLHRSLRGAEPGAGGRGGGCAVDGAPARCDRCGASRYRHP